jgi:hypothetical protein
MSPRSIHRGPIPAIRTSQAATSSFNHQLERMLRATSVLLLLPMPKIIGLPGHWRTGIFSHEAQIALEDVHHASRQRSFPYVYPYRASSQRLPRMPTDLVVA